MMDFSRLESLLDMKTATINVFIEKTAGDITAAQADILKEIDEKIIQECSRISKNNKE